MDPTEAAEQLEVVDQAGVTDRAEAADQAEAADRAEAVPAVGDPSVQVLVCGALCRLKHRRRGVRS